jgi:hypothetical protein
MILLAIEQSGGRLILHAADTYSGSTTALAAATTDEMLLRFHPLLRSWLDLSKGKNSRIRNLEPPPVE